MSGNAGILDSRPQALFDEQIAVANATGLYLDAHLAWPGVRNLAFDDLESGSGFRNLRHPHCCYCNRCSCHESSYEFRLVLNQYRALGWSAAKINAAVSKKDGHLRRLELIPAPIALGTGSSLRQEDHATCVAAPVSIKFVTTLMLPCVALEYGHCRCAPSIIFWAVSRAIPGRLTLRRA